MVDELLISPLLLGDGHVGQGGFKVHDLLHQRPRRLLGAAQENPQLYQEVDVRLQILHSPNRKHGEVEMGELGTQKGCVCVRVCEKVTVNWAKTRPYAQHFP